ncbi:MAG: NAD-dependent epimerase/dehydratase family protein [Ignavibacteriales bacterium]|nr:NAD-dependent epimerase/dehydratase family protein [Ignavibacteriales bacterium]
MFEAARKAGVRRAVIASSAAVYGDSDGDASRWRKLRSSRYPRMRFPSASTEMYAELVYPISFGFEVVALRYFNVYGPRQRPDSMYAAAVPIFTRRLLDGKPVTIFGDGGQSRDLINVRDVVRANLLAARASRRARTGLQRLHGRRDPFARPDR